MSTETEKNSRHVSSMFIYTMLKGPAINTPEMACDLARMVFVRYEGEEKLAREEPFRYRDNGDSWSVSGSYQPEDMPVGSGIWFMEINKSDAQIFKVARNLTMKALGEWPSEGQGDANAKKME